MEAIFTIELFWFLLGAIFFVLELIVPGVLFVFFGIAAWFTGGLKTVWDISIEAQLVTFFLVSLIGLLTLRKLFREKVLGKEKPSKEELADEFVGRSVIAETDFDEYGNGKVAFRGSTWNAKAKNPVRKGDQLRIVGKHNIHLEVEPQDDPQ